MSLYQEAQSANAAFLSVRAGVAADMENENITRGQLLPNVSFSGNYGRNTADRTIANAPTESFDYDSSAYNINLRQPIYRKYNLASHDQAKAQGLVAEARLSQARNELIVRLSGAYLDVLFADDQIRLLEAEKTAIKAQLLAAEKGLIAGSGTRIDIDEAQARFDMVEAQELESANSRQNSRRVLGAFVNREVVDLAKLDLSRFKLLMPIPQNVDAWIAAAEASNAEYQGLLAQRKVAEQEVEKALAGHYPNLDFVANAGKSGNDNLSTLNRFGDTEYSTTSYGIQLTIPLFAGGQVTATVRQGKAKLEQVAQQAEEMRRNLSVRTKREYDNIVQGMARIRALERAESSGRQTVVSAKSGVKAGIRSTLDVLVVERQYFTVLRDLFQARYAYLIAGLKLKGLAGVISEADLVDVSGQFSAGLGN
ncbi:MAG TPA: TolC family outer membrane protein [Azonexus sp.]|nr:TolC family outer membrane protein [Azonexus sp.]